MKKARSLMRLLFTTGLFMVLIGLVLLREDDIVAILNSYVLQKNTVVTLGEKNEYYRDYDFQFIQNTTNFSPTNRQELLNIYYTVINSGQTSFTFYCPKEYVECLDEVQTIANSQTVLSDINNFVHPYNGFSHIETEYDTLGRVTITIVKSYTSEQIQEINAKIDELYPQLVSDDRTKEDNIKSVHDYIIDHAKYDSDRSDRNIIAYKSDIAYGPLLEGYAICGGYTDLMELFLEKMNIESYKVSSDNHVWNAVHLGSSWYHLDLTWDDPVSTDGKDYLDDSYVLISTSKLLSLEKTQHQFDQDVYSELKEA